MQTVLSVLHTLRSNEWKTAAAKSSTGAVSAATIQAPPVPCRLTGMPACRATEPSWETASPEPRATARLKRESENMAQPAAWEGESTSETAPLGIPASSSDGPRA